MDEFKKIKFRNGDKIYVAHAVDLTGKTIAGNGNFLKPIAVFRIYDENDKEFLGGIVFQESTLLGFMWAEPNKKHFPNKKYLEEALVNLLHYLPFTSETLTPNASFNFQFVRDLEDGLMGEKRAENIKTIGSFEETYQRKMFGENASSEKIQMVILEPLYMHWLDNSRTNLLFEHISSILPFKQNVITSHLELLEDENFIEIQRDASQNFVSVKIKPRGVKKVLGTLQDDVKSNSVANYHYGHNIDVKTGNHSSVSIHADMIGGIFGEYKKELEEKNPQNKQEISDALSVLESEFKKEEKDQGKIKKSLGIISKGAGWLYEKITNNQFIGSILAQIALQQMGLPPQK
ncbi:MAG: hypothetical protein AAB609_02745 [Patescibacteria group bacterium]